MKPSFRRFNDLRKTDINFDFHVHTSQTDGVATPEEIVARAVELGLSAVAFTEHVTRTSAWFGGFRERIRSLDASNLKVFVGVEAKPLDFAGTIDATPEMLDSDIVVGSVHRYPSPDGGLIDLERVKSLENADEIEFNLAMGMLKAAPIDVLGHPFGVYASFHHKFPAKYFKILCEESLKRKIAIEINTKYIVAPDELFGILKDVNPYVSIGSDMHNVGELARSFDVIKRYVEE